VLVEGVYPGCPADGNLYPTDLVKSINGTPVEDAAAASKAIDAVPTSAPIDFRVEQAGQVEDVKLTRAACGNSKTPLVGVSMIDNFPFSVKMTSDSISGPSAGLMWSLGLYDLLTPGDLTGGRTIAGTGAIDSSGKVYPIGGVDKKIVAAKKAGAELFFVPRDNLAEAQKAADGLKLVPVDSFSDALAALNG
jgi:PDZ domain-containing protein